MKKLFSFIVIVFLLVSNANADIFGFSKKMQKLSPGDSPSSVEKKLGKADGFKVNNEYMVYHYNHKIISGWAWDRADFHVIFKNNSVVEYGMGEVRQKDINGVQSFFIFSY
jgi:hypothetical protein